MFEKRAYTTIGCYLASRAPAFRRITTDNATEVFLQEPAVPAEETVKRQKERLDHPVLAHSRFAVLGTFSIGLEEYLEEHMCIRGQLEPIGTPEVITLYSSHFIFDGHEWDGGMALLSCFICACDLLRRQQRCPPFGTKGTNQPSA